MNGFTKRIPYLALWWGWMPMVYGIVWTFLHVFTPGSDKKRGLDLFMMDNVWSGGGWLWVWLLIGFIGMLVIGGFDLDKEQLVSPIAIVISLVLIAGSVFQLWRVLWDNDKDFGRYYNATTTFYVSDLNNMPDSLNKLVKGAHKGDSSRCDLIGRHDVPSCIKQGTLPSDGWEPRIGSLDGAKIAIKRRTGDIQGVSLDEDTMAYLNASNGQPASWSGILNGSGKYTPISAVAQWSGQGQPTICTFSKQYKLDRSFGGNKGNSLTNLLADRYPALIYNIEDVWGFCKDGKPAIVIPMIRKIYYKDRTVETAGGIVLLTGHNGKTILDYKSTVKSGEYPGPVYPASLVATQRKEASWAAGRKYHDNFGYEPGSSDVQAGNVSEYLLRDKTTGRLQFVTPLTLSTSTSELFVAYAVSNADEITDRQLNPLSIYVLDPSDNRRVNLDTLEADAKNYFANNAGTFISNGGKLVEFTPIDGDVWRGFGELNGQVVYRLDISASSKIEPKLVALTSDVAPTPGGPTQPVTPSNTECGKPLNQLTPNQLTTCIQQLANELAKRQVPASK